MDMDSTYKKYLPRRKVAFGTLFGSLAVLAIAFAPRMGIELNEDEKGALKSALATLAVTVGTAYMVPGETLKEEEDTQIDNSNEGDA